MVGVVAATALVGGGLVGAGTAGASTPSSATKSVQAADSSVRALSAIKPGSKCKKKQKGKILKTKKYGKLKCTKKGKKYVWKKVAKKVASPAPVSCAAGGGAANTCALGNTGPGGGKVFYVNNAAANGSRYMEAVVAGMTPAWDDRNGGTRYLWCVGFGQMNNVITGTAIGAYLVNTNNMVAACTSGAANRVRAYTGGGLAAGSWSLPSLNELNALDISGVGGLSANNFYWSSTQHNVASQQNDVPWAWFQSVGYGGGSDHQGFLDKNSALHVRPVRAF